MPDYSLLERDKMLNLDRRQLIKTGGSLALIAGVSRSPLFAAPLGANPFTLGVAAGDPWPDGFVIWTRLAPHPLEEHGGMPAAHISVRWEVAEDEGFSHVVRKGEVMALPELAHSVHVEVDGLRPRRCASSARRCTASGRTADRQLFMSSCR